MDWKEAWENWILQPAGDLSYTCDGQLAWFHQRIDVWPWIYEINVLISCWLGQSWHCRGMSTQDICSASTLFDLGDTILVSDVWSWFINQGLWIQGSYYLGLTMGACGVFIEHFFLQKVFAALGSTRYLARSNPRCVQWVFQKRQAIGAEILGPSPAPAGLRRLNEVARCGGAEGRNRMERAMTPPHGWVMLSNTWITSGMPRTRWDR